MTSFKDLVDKELSDITIQESIIGTPIKFGVNETMDDGKIRLMGGYQYTLFQMDDLVYAIWVSRDGIFDLGVSTGYSPNIRDFRKSRLRSPNLIRNLNTIIAILMELLKTANLRIYTLKFVDDQEMLGKLYNRFIKNRRIPMELRRIGFKYVGKMQENPEDEFESHIFVRVS